MTKLCATWLLIKDEPILLILLFLWRLPDLILAVGRGLRSWCMSLGVWFLIFSSTFLLGPPIMTADRMALFVLAAGTVTAWHMHEMWGRP